MYQLGFSRLEILWVSLTMLLEVIRIALIIHFVPTRLSAESAYRIRKLSDVQPGTITFIR